MIVVIDYNVGNVKSVCNAFRHIGCEVELSCEPGAVEKAEGIVLPGVAAFGYAVSALGALGGVIREVSLAGKPLLGICVGYQMLFEQSCEYGRHKGLGLIEGKVVPIPKGRVIPHMGWNLVKLRGDMELFGGLESEKHFYFAHSFYAEISDSQAKTAYTDYGTGSRLAEGEQSGGPFEMPAAVQKGNIYGTQFHPEKSGKTGLKVLQNFYDICKRGRS
jgi:glutamine amidotransferase